MKITGNIRLLAAVLAVGFALPLRAQSIQRLKVHLFTRQAEKGYVSAIQGDMFYSANGNLVSNFTSPSHYIMITNNLGEVRIYNPQKNTVIQFQNSLFSSHITPFYYFLSGRTGDMGLHEAGYEVTSTRFDQKLVVTVWKRIEQDEGKDPVVYVKLVHDKDRPIYMDYENADHHIIRKVYYYSYTHVGDIDFPGVFTEIVYQGADSVVSKTEYSDFRINGQAESPLFDFKIPADAKLVKQ